MIAAMAIAASYLVGSIPTGYWLGRALRGVDIREHGSKNIGATNTLRVLGKTLGGTALLGDVLKGTLPVLAAAQLDLWHYLPLTCGLAAILGHTLSIFLSFKGGKGVATTAGVFLGLAPISIGIALATFGVVTAASRMVSAGSVAGAIALSVAIFAIPGNEPVLQGITVLICLLVIVRHRENVQRILNGTESRLGEQSSDEEQTIDSEQ